MKKSVRQYLERYAETESKLLALWPTVFQQAMLIPAKDEAPELIKHCKNFCEQHTGTLLLLIINQAESSEGSPANQTLWQQGLNSGSLVWEHDHLKLIQWRNNSALLLIDRFSPGRQIPEHQGVGLARKIAADIAAKLMIDGFIRRRWIYSSDADCRWPTNYFITPTAPNDKQLSGLKPAHGKRIVAAHFSFQHSPCNNNTLTEQTKHDVHAATRLYEQSLHYYRDGLNWAGSPYDFYTIGSCLAFDVEAYCEVRGFPCRAAGEDFYLLNKLAKLGYICQLDSQVISIESRLSQRAPFGTGPAVSGILAQQVSHDDFPSYHPQCFAHLKTLLDSAFEIIIEEQGEAIILSALKTLGAKKFRRHLEQQHVKTEQFEREFHTWFDGFRTLKFIHYLRDECFPLIPMSEGIQQLDLWKGSVIER
ncbi:hypothetical protein [Pseudoteredinibacter isoporae]|uniref:hypothetical protein n=1 Tax=Pseudoteredinibacter isoporae TaxID=570281 RepID=UPI003106C43F